jgi:hypothetical protein
MPLAWAARAAGPALERGRRRRAGGQLGLADREGLTQQRPQVVADDRLGIGGGPSGRGIEGHVGGLAHEVRRCYIL